MIVKIYLLLTFLNVAFSQNLWQDYYEKTISFTVFNNLTSEGEITSFDTNLTSHGCEEDGKVAIIVHGWLESFSSLWVKDLIDNLVKHRGGCVLFMDYSNYSLDANYLRLVQHFYYIGDLLLRKIQHIGIYDQMFLFGFSFGAQLTFEAGARLGYQLIDRIDACDPTGVIFDWYSRTVDPKRAAKHVGCVHTSSDKGTPYRTCHQNYVMGKCGQTEPAAGPFLLGSHGLCPHFYNAAFEHNFTANNLYECVSWNPAKDLPEGFKMGYNKTPEELAIHGDIFVPTSKEYPWNDMNDLE